MGQVREATHLQSRVSEWKSEWCLFARRRKAERNQAWEDTLDREADRNMRNSCGINRIIDFIKKFCNR